MSLIRSSPRCLKGTVPEVYLQDTYRSDTKYLERHLESLRKPYQRLLSDFYKTLIRLLMLPLIPDIRRMLGLFVFFYATLHLLTYVGIDYRFNWEPILDDVIKKKYIYIGFSAWLLLVPLAVTSSKKMMKLLKHNWKKLHRLFYIIAIFGSLHFICLSKTIFFKPLIYTVIILILLSFRVKFKI